MTERFRRQLEKIEALMDPPETMKVNITIVYIDPATGRPTGEVTHFPPEKDGGAEGTKR
jgi:hypothetical protein